MSRSGASPAWCVSASMRTRSPEATVSTGSSERVEVAPVDGLGRRRQLVQRAHAAAASHAPRSAANAASRPARKSAIAAALAARKRSCSASEKPPGSTRGAHVPASLAARSSASSSSPTGVEAQLVEVAQAPRRVVAGVPDRDRAADELVAARALHPVDAQERAADADGVRRRPGARGVVLRRHEPVARVERDGDRRADVDVAEAEHEVGRAEDDRRARRPRRRRPLMRRMNSMLSGHHGASGRIDAW